MHLLLEDHTSTYFVSNEKGEFVNLAAYKEQ